jgi:hypothetical protein
MKESEVFQVTNVIAPFSIYVCACSKYVLLGNKFVINKTDQEIYTCVLQTYVSDLTA